MHGTRLILYACDQKYQAKLGIFFFFFARR